MYQLRCEDSVTRLKQVGIAWGVAAVLSLAANSARIAAQEFPDPDDVMRLLQVRDLIAGQGWFDLGQYRVNTAAGGVPMHWSRLVDLPLLLVILVLGPVFGSAVAESVAVVVVPLITLGLIVALAMRIAARVLGDEPAMLAGLLIGMSVTVMFQIAPLRIDHHGWQIVCALAAVNGLLARSPEVGGRICGAALASWLSISIEGLPLAAAICGVLALRWLRQRADRGWLIGALQSLAVTSSALFLITRGLGDLAPWCDALNPVHLAMFAWGAAVLTVLGKREPVPVGSVLVGFAIAGGGALAMLLMAAPQCATGGGFAGLDPLVAKYWYANVLEGQPIWRHSLTSALGLTLTPAFGLVGAIVLARRSQGWLARFWCDYALILGAALMIGVFVARAGVVATVIAAPPLAYLVHGWLQRIRSIERLLPRVVGLVAIGCVMLPALPLNLMLAIPAHASREPTVTRESVKESCDVAASAKLMAKLPRGSIYAPLDIAPQILLETRHDVLATAHHRGDDAIRAVIATAQASPAEAEAMLRARGLDYVALCSAMEEPHIYASGAPDGFMARLLEDEVPSWLEPITLEGSGSAFKVWRVRPE